MNTAAVMLNSFQHPLANKGQGMPTFVGMTDKGFGITTRGVQ